MSKYDQAVEIRNAYIIDGSGELPSYEMQTLLVEDGRIKSIYPASSLNEFQNTIKVDANGGYILPGLIDCHDHLANLEGSMVQRAAIPPTLAVFKTAEAFRKTLLAGFTTIRDAGGVDYGMKLAVEEKLIPGPRLKTSIVILSQTGGHNDHTEPAGIDSQFPVLQTIPSAICDGPEACRRKVREVIQVGADWIKIASTGGVGTPVGGPLTPQFSLEETETIVRTAHQAGKPVMSHAYGGEGLKICLKAGVDSIEHGSVLTVEDIKNMLANNTWLVPTFTVLRKIISLGKLNPSPLPSYMLPKALSLLDSQKKSFLAAFNAGVNMAMGTDLGSFGHGQNALELMYLVEAGISPVEAIKLATSQGAKCLGIQDGGLVREGKLADLILIDRDPLKDITCLQDEKSIKFVMKDGIIYKNYLEKNNGCSTTNSI